MKRTKIKIIIRNDWPLYLAAVFAAPIMWHFSRMSDTDALTWILAPTARWAGILGGISFEYLPHQGYVNHFHQFLVASSCSGCRFMLLTFLMLLFIPVREVSGRRACAERYGGIPNRCRWIGFSMVAAYVSTVFVNGIRIVLSIRIPDMLEKFCLPEGWLTPDRLHTLIGTVVYFTSLCLIYRLAASSTGQFGLFVPLFWYLLIVIAWPSAKRICSHNWEGFGQYAALIIGVCTVVCVMFKTVEKSR